MSEVKSTRNIFCQKQFFYNNQLSINENLLYIKTKRM